VYAADILCSLISTFCHSPRRRNPRLRIQATGKNVLFFNSSEIIQLDYWKNRTSQLLRYCTLWLGLSLMNSFYQLSTIFTFRLPVDYVLR